MYKKYCKHIFDTLTALFLVVLIMPILMICGLMIKLEDGGPVFYFSKRLGKNERLFKMYKLRTMKVNAPDIRNEDGSTFNAEDDPRLTRIGRLLRKTSLDELPQIFNVLKGDMSFIGPRPDLPEHVNFYEGEEIRKLEVLPGISGYNQAYYRNSLEWKQRLKNDIYYVDNISFLFDIKIAVKTVSGIVLSRGIYNDSQDKTIKG